MSDLLRNLFAVGRANIICGIEKCFGRCEYHNIVRIFKHADIRIDKKGRLIMDSGSAIGQGCMCVVRDNAILHMGQFSNFNSDCKIVCHEKIEIGENTIFGPNVLIYDHDHIFDSETGVHRKEYKSSPIVIGRNCWIGAGSIILRGTVIGDNCVVGAGSVVKGVFPNGSKIVQKK